MRAIDADALIEKCGGSYVDECTESGFIGTLENLLAAEPTIQPQSTTGQLNDSAQSTAQSTDLIDRQAAIDALNKQIQQCRKALGSLSLSDVDKHAVEVKMASLRAYRGMLENLPTIQPEPQEGHWIRTDCGFDVECKCSKCGYKDFVQPRDEYWFNRNFCPNCGAKMKGERQK